MANGGTATGPGPTIWNRSTERFRHWKRIEWRRSQEAPLRTVLVVVGALLFLLGLLAFAMFQTQVLFTDNVRVSEIRPGLVPRNDGGILFGAALSALGTTVMLAALSPRPARERVVPALVFAASSATLLWTHFTIFVNAFLVPTARMADVTASFLFHDTAEALPIATFLLAFFTFLVIIAAFGSGLALVAPRVWEHRIRHPRTVDEHRTRLALFGLLIVGTGAAFARQFFTYALTGDSHPTGGLLRTNVTVVYYLLSFGLILALATLAWRTYILVWGDLRGTRSINFRRGYATLAAAETWLWAIILLLNTVLLFAGPTYQPDARVDRVFTVNSKGVSIFFVLIFGMYAIQRHVSTAYLRFLMRHPSPPHAPRLDHLGRLSIAVIAVWATFGLLLIEADVTPLTKLLIRVALVSLILPFFAVRFDTEQLGRPLLRTPGSPYILLAAATLSILAGIMLWGIGNSVVTRYAESGGFVTPDQTVLQPYATGIRVLGSFFLALPITLSLWFLATRHRANVHPGPLLVAGFSIILGMNLLLTINAADPRDVVVGRTDVLIGFSVIGLHTVYDKVILLSAWIATAAMGFLATAVLVRRGVEEKAPGQDSRGNTTRA